MRFSWPVKHTALCKQRCVIWAASTPIIIFISAQALTPRTSHLTSHNSHCASAVTTTPREAAGFGCENVNLIVVASRGLQMVVRLSTLF